MAIDPMKLQTLNLRLDNTLARLEGAERRYADADQPRESDEKFAAISGAAHAATEKANNGGSVEDHLAARNAHQKAATAHVSALRDKDGSKSSRGYSEHYSAYKHHEEAAQVHNQARDSHPSSDWAKKYDPSGEEHAENTKAAMAQSKGALHWAKEADKKH